MVPDLRSAGSSGRPTSGILGKNLGENNGESRRVCLLEKYPGWVFKEYLAPVPLVEVQAARPADQPPRGR